MVLKCHFLEKLSHSRYCFAEWRITSQSFMVRVWNTVYIYREHIDLTCFIIIYGRIDKFFFFYGTEFCFQAIEIRPLWWVLMLFNLCLVDHHLCFKFLQARVHVSRMCQSRNLVIFQVFCVKPRSLLWKYESLPSEKLWLVS